MSRVKKFALSAAAAVAVALGATTAQAHWFYPYIYTGPHYYYRPIVRDVVLNPVIVDTSVAVMFRANSASPWTVYARYATYNDAVGVANTLRTRGFETLVQ